MVEKYVTQKEFKEFQKEVIGRFNYIEDEAHRSTKNILILTDFLNERIKLIEHAFESWKIKKDKFREKELKKLEKKEEEAKK